jgi:hypothetical protein
VEADMTRASKTFTVTVTAAVTGFDYYIGPSGSNSNPGTSGSPWGISALSTKPQIAGKRIGLLDGTYVSTNSDFESAGILVNYSGTALAPTVVEAVNPRQAIITGWNGSSYVGLQGLIGTTSASYVTFRGLRVTNGAYKGFIAFGTGTNIVIENCQIDNFRSARAPGAPAGDNCEGIRAEHVSDLTIRNCKIFDMRNGSDNWNGSCIKNYATNRMTVEYCDLSQSGVAIYDKQNDPLNTVFRYNYVHDCSNANPVQGFDLEAAGPNGTFKIHNNVIVGTGAYYCQDTGSSGGRTYLEIYNNTYVASGTPSGVWVGLTGGPYLKFYNNITYRPGFGGGYRGDLNITSPANAPIVDYNCYDPSAVYFALGAGPSSTYTTLSSWRTATGREAGSIQANPLFVGSGAGPTKYALQSGSSLKNAGRVGGTSGGATVDIGAYGGATQVGTDW